MDGLEAVEIQFSELEIPIRIDAEVYQKIYIEINEALDKLKNTSLGKEVKTIKKGIFDIKAECYAYFGIPFVRISNLKNMQIDDNDIIYIPENEHSKNIDTELKRNDVILSKTAYPAASLVTLPICNTSQDTVAIKLKSKSQILTHYLVTFLNSIYGYYQMQRWFTGNIQMHLNLTDCKEILIPILTSDFQEIQKNLFEAALSLLEKSRNLYKQAEDLLLSELGLQDWQPTEETITVKSFAESFLSSGRLDAEYYKPKYDELYDCLKISCSKKRWDLKRLKDLSSLFKYGTSEPFEYLDQGVPFLRIADLRKYRFSEKELKYISQEAAKKQQANVKTGDVLISRSGTLGLAVVIPGYLNNAVYGSYFILTRPDKKSILPAYFAFYINSLVGKLQTEQANTGGIQTNLTIPVLESLLIACPPLAIQQKFVNKVNQSYEAEDKSKQLLSIAKTGVEGAIETDEETATDWINQQLEHLNINLIKERTK
jgi:restriction endonuclease S subunit